VLPHSSSQLQKYKAAHSKSAVKRTPTLRWWQSTNQKKAA